MKILSFGAGAIGTYIGGSLALAGHQLVFVERESIAAELQQRGLILDLSVDPRRAQQAFFTIPGENLSFAGSLAAALEQGPFDVALFALKSYDTQPALQEIKQFAHQMPPLLCLSNGVDNETALAEVLGENKVIYGTVTSAIGRPRAGEIVLEKLRGVGVAAGHPLSEKLVATMSTAFLNARLYARAADMKWSKMLTNLVANPLSAILDMTAAEIFEHPGLYRVEIAQLRECLQVMKALGIRVTDLPGTPVKALAFAASLPAGLSRPMLARVVGSGRGGKMPSFHIDLHSGRGKSEVNFLHGAVVRAGEQAEVPTPVNQRLTRILLGLTSGDIPMGEYARQPEKFLNGS